MSSDLAAAVADTVRAALAATGLEPQEPRPGVFFLDLPGERKLSTPCQLVVGDHALAVHAFVCRNPDENHEGVYRWLLSRNLRLYGVAFGIDHTGDIYLDGRLPLEAVTATEVDRLLGAVLMYADESFNTILELGLRLLDPRGVGVAAQARRVDPQPRRLPWLARGAPRRRTAVGESQRPWLATALMAASAASGSRYSPPTVTGRMSSSSS